MKISEFSIKRPVFTIVTMFLVIILGAVSFFKIPVTLIPELNPPVAVVVSNYDGASPTEVNEKVTKPLEQSLSTAPGLKTMQSISQEGSNFILLMFDWSTVIDDVQLDIMQRVDQVPMPEGASAPRFMKFDPSQFPVIQLTLRSTDKDVDIRPLAEELETELRRTKGVASVTVSGKVTEEIKVVLNEEELQKNRLAQSDIVQAIQANNVSMPGEPIKTDDGKQLTTRIISSLTTLDDVRDVVVGRTEAGEMLRVKDVATVDIHDADSGAITRANDDRAVLVNVLQESGANTASVSKEFKSTLDDLLDKKEYKKVEADILFDQGDYVNLAIGNIGQSLLLGGLFAMIVLFVFLHGIKSPIIIGVAIPYSVIVTFVLMFFADFSLNIMTLGALALGIGMLVDNAIVVIENIERHLAMGKEANIAARDGAKEIGGAITASTLTTLAVFVPVIFISGLIGQIFTEFALTISFSLFASLVVALTVVPMMASKMLKTPDLELLAARKRRTKKSNRFGSTIRWALDNRPVVLLATIIVLGASIFGLTRVGTEFLPPTDEGFVSVAVELPNGASLESTDKIVKEIEEELQREKDVEVYVSLVGGTQQNMAQGTAQTNVAEIYIKMVPLEERSRSVFEFVDDVQPEIVDLLEDRATVNFNLQTAAGSEPNTVTFSLSDTNESRLEKAVKEVDEELQDMKSVLEVSNTLGDTVEEVHVTVDREKAAEQGLAPAQISQTVNSVTRGTFATQIVGEDEEVLAMYVQYDEKFRDSIDQLKQIKLLTPAGTYINLEDVATVAIAEAPVSIQRVDQAHSVSFTVKYESDRSLGEMTTQVNDMIDKLKLPEEIDMNYGGDRELFESAINDMLLAIVLAVVLVYIVMAAQFESFKYPFVIMFSVPLMVIGVAIGLFVTNTPLSVTAVIGVLVLVGIVVNNGIVLVDYINQQKEKGMHSYEAIIHSAEVRVRPILMTALTTILGLLPLALGIGEGTEMNQPMGIAVIGGLLTSTLLTLYIVPVMYSLFDSQTRSKKNWPEDVK